MSEHAVTVFGRKSGGFDWTERVFQEFPGFNLVKELEQKHAKRDFVNVLVPGINDILNQVLADSVRRPINVRELECVEYRIVRPGRIGL